MKIIFLDIDGVLNSMNFYKYKTSRQLIAEPLDRENGKFLKQIVDETDAKIVITSSWRGGWEKDPEKCTSEGKILNDFLGSFGLSIYDKTVVSGSGRAWEIKWFLQSCDEKVTDFVILDDNDYQWKKNGFAHNIVQTDFNDGGLKAEHAEKAIQILNRKHKSLFHFGV